jgi:hypothetical protein
MTPDPLHVVLHTLIAKFEEALDQNLLLDYYTELPHPLPHLGIHYIKFHPTTNTAVISKLLLHIEYQYHVRCNLKRYAGNQYILEVWWKQVD